MGLINKRKLLTTINSLSIDFKDDGNKAHYGSEIVFRHGFLQGMYFAETELQNLAIEFAEWKDLYFFESERHLGNIVLYIPYGKDSTEHTITQLFTKFIEQRKIN